MLSLQVLLEQEISRAAARRALLAAEAQQAAQAWGPGPAADHSSHPNVNRNPNAPCAPWLYSL